MSIEQTIIDNTKIIGSNPQIIKNHTQKIKSNSKISAKQIIIDNSQIIELPRAEINIFDSEFYLNRYPDVAQSIAKTDQEVSFTSGFSDFSKSENPMLLP